MQLVEEQLVELVDPIEVEVDVKMGLLAKLRGIQFFLIFLGKYFW